MINLEHEFSLLAAELKEVASFSCTPVQIINLLDLTLLDEQASLQDLINFQDKIAENPIAAVCVYPQHFQHLRIPLPIKRATVVNFPRGCAPLAQTLKEIEQAVHHHHVNEIDYVFPYQAYLAGDSANALKHCQQASNWCQQHKITFKVILETGVYSSPYSIYHLAKALINQGCHFIKTSTGKIMPGATPLAVYTILRALKEENNFNCGIKISGGVKKYEQAWFYLHLATYYLNKPVNNNWLRIGASSLLDEINQHSV